MEWAASDAWVAVPTSASQRAPLPRYEHAGAMLGHNFIVVGGNYGKTAAADASVLQYTSIRCCLWSSGLPALPAALSLPPSTLLWSS